MQKQERTRKGMIGDTDTNIMIGTILDVRLCFIIIFVLLGYGEQGDPPEISAAATLVFEVDLLSINGKTHF